jgi:hypothetical protein
MSEIARITGVFSSPGATFRDIAARPRWWIPVILMAIMSTVFLTAFGARIGFEQPTRQALEASPRAAQMTPAQLERAAQVGGTILRVVQYGSLVIVFLSIFFPALVFKFVFDVILGADIGLQRMLGIVAYAWLPTLISGALSLLVLNLKSPEDFNINNPLAFNAGAFLSSDSSAWMKSLGASLDLFSFWIIILIAIGVSVAGRKISFGKALAGVIFPWALYVVLKVGAAALQG